MSNNRTCEHEGCKEIAVIEAAAPMLTTDVRGKIANTAFSDSRYFCQKHYEAAKVEDSQLEIQALLSKEEADEQL